MSQDSDSSVSPSSDAPQSDNGFVALLDVLGFKRMTPSRQQAVAASLEQAVDEVLPSIGGLRYDDYARWLKKPCVRMFSDTIVIAFPRMPNGPVAQDLFHFVNDTLGLLYCCLFTDGILLRGSVGYGSIWERRYGVFGSAIIDAQAEYEETSWAGIHYSANATLFIKQWHSWAMERGVRDTRQLAGTEHNLNQTQFYVADVPFKCSYKLPTSVPPELVRMRFVVPWPKDFRMVFDRSRILGNDCQTAHARIYEVVEAELHGCEDKRVNQILDNTMKFADTYLAKFPGVNRPIEWHGPLPASQ